MNFKISDIEKIFSNREPGVIDSRRDFSVLVPLVKKNGELNLLFEVRASNLKRQPGEVCFPGGGIENGESAEACAIRETAEELGIDAKAIRVITQLDSIFNYSNFTLYSFLGEIDYEELQKAKINSKEVASIFYVPLADFMSQEPYIYKMGIIPEVGDDFPYEMVNSTSGYNWRKGFSEVPIYKFGGETIWGLTARIMHNLVKILQSSQY